MTCDVIQCISCAYAAIQSHGDYWWPYEIDKSRYVSIHILFINKMLLIDYHPGDWRKMEWMVKALEGWLPLVLVGLLLMATVAYWRMTWADLPPGPWGLPGLGYLLSIDSKAPYETFSDLARRYGPVYSLRLGGLLTVFVSDPQLIRQAFSQDVFSGRAPLYLTHGIMQGHGTFMFHFFFSIDLFGFDPIAARIKQNVFGVGRSYEFISTLWNGYSAKLQWWDIQKKK